MLSQPVADPRFELSPEQVYAVALGWRQLLRETGLELVASEAKVVNDELRLAGSLDRLARTTRPLQFDTVTVPAGIVVVLDIKSSALNPDNDGLPSYWDGYPIQIEAYRASVPYDVDTDERGEWEQTPDDQHALIAHIDVPALHEGRAVWSLVYVDLDTARCGIAAVQMARHYHSLTKFAASTECTTVEVAPPASRCAPSMTSGADDETTRAELRERKARMKANAHDTGWGFEFDRQWRASGVTPESTNDEVRVALDQIEPPFDPEPSPVPEPVVEVEDPTPEALDDGGPLDERALGALLAAVSSSAHQELLNRWLREGREHGVPWQPKVTRRVRQFEIARAAIALAVATDGVADTERDAFARAVIEFALKGDTGTSVGITLGKLTIAEALAVVDAAERVGHDLAYLVDADGFEVVHVP